MDQRQSELESLLEDGSHAFGPTRSEAARRSEVKTSTASRRPGSRGWFSMFTCQEETKLGRRGELTGWDQTPWMGPLVHVFCGVGGAAMGGAFAGGCDRVLC